MSRRQPSSPPRIDGFRFVELLGMGGFADVFKYEQLGLGRPVGVKVLFRGLGDSGQAAFEAEASLMAQLSNHPSIVSIYAASAAADGRPYLVMEYCPPPGLDKRIRRKPMAVAKAIEIVIQVSGAVETAHRLGILHRDVKPANILFTEFGRPALTDFGISVSTAPGSTAAGGSGASVPWAPPEQQVDGAVVGREADVYSLAATLWTMLVGRSPFEVDGGPNDAWEMSQRVRSNPVPVVGRPDVPESLERLLRTAMAKDPAQRYGTALEFARALQSVQADLHLPMTAIDIRDERLPDDVVEEEDDGGTRVSGYVAIDPDGSPTSSTWSRRTGNRDHTGRTAGTTGSSIDGHRILQHGRGAIDAVEPVVFTAPALPSEEHAQPVDLQVPQPVTSAGSRSAKPLVAVGASALLIAGAVAGYLALKDDGGAATTAQSSTSEAAVPVDPLGGVVAAPTSLTGKLAGKVATFTWRNPEPKPGDTYLYRVIDPSKAEQLLTTSDTTVTVSTLPGRTCLEVKVLRTSGKASDAVTKCTETP
ncbi:serine/threonine-protein kinase [Yimella sp. cx-51]|uniref:serine/threonine-protein kinase n=1 Tax=Yimella sp. cx-51 TaxID=2770551 RepID=UPI00165D4B00|nr:serine/threonine-protein kinase [Yimella sp. cx-51]MBC9955942.1 serine/threonine protein kinase [Yimella sp. cx-51]QTH37518.1 serine/threonine protein kinase [Yimella sp. cx-51]